MREHMLAQSTLGRSRGCFFCSYMWVVEILPSLVLELLIIETFLRPVQQKLFVYLDTILPNLCTSHKMGKQFIEFSEWLHSQDCEIV